MGDLSDALAKLQARAVETPAPPSMVVPQPAPGRTSAKHASRAALRETLKSEAVTAAEAERARLIADMTDAKIAAVASAAMLEAVESAWDRAPTHSDAELARIERLREEAPAAALKVSVLETQLSACETRLAELTRNEARGVKQARAREVYAPAVAALGEAVTHLLAALAKEQQARLALEREDCWGHQYIPDAGLGLWDPRGGDDLVPTLRRWIAEARTNGYDL